MIDPKLKTEYTDHHALIIGIDDFKNASPLGYAVSDAQAIGDILTKNFDFPVDRIQVLTNNKATRKNIMASYMAYEKTTSDDDRLLIFYAGHGLTQMGKRGEVGFLVPHDGNPDDLSTLIRWDELTYNAELIKAKHILFIMDACYGGCALSRGLPAGSMRFLKDMLLRPVRQVLTAGKADEVVADSGGPRPNHSVFTGHLLDALEGQAEKDGILTANGVMAYVYDRVSKDVHSRQTPHFGFFEGDGDFIFKAPIIGDLTKDKETDEDILISVAPSSEENGVEVQSDFVTLVKENIAEPGAIITLHDTSINSVRKFLYETRLENFPVKDGFSNEAFISRLDDYQTTVNEIQKLTSCLAYWGKNEHKEIIRKIISRATDQLKPEDGLIIWNALRWYPIILLLYSAGIAAVSARKYDNLLELFTAPTYESEEKNIIFSIGRAMSESISHEVFKKLPGHERQYTPVSEYLFKFLQPILDDLFFLGKEYEREFDRFEILLALKHADLDDHIWGPVGRFGWKYRRGVNPWNELMVEARHMTDNWPPVKAGLFESFERFDLISTQYEEIILQKLGWL